MSTIRARVAVLIFVLAVAPAISHLGERVEHGRVSNPTFSFRKSVDIPPDLIVVAPDAIIPAARMVWVVPQTVHQLRHDDELIPATAVPVESTALRAPPSLPA
jgi:hypothetical protein